MSRPRKVQVITRHFVVIEEATSDVGEQPYTRFEQKRFDKGKMEGGLTFPKELELTNEFKDLAVAQKVASKADAYYRAVLACGKWVTRGHSATLDEKPKK